MREIVKRGADVNLRLPKGTPNVPQHVLAHRRRGGDAISLRRRSFGHRADAVLLELGADPLLPNFDKTTPLMAAAGLGTTEPLEEAGEEAEALEAVKMLLDLGADINAVDDNGDTAMHGAAYGNYPLVVQLLADRGARPQLWKERNRFGRTPLFIAEGYQGGRSAVPADDRRRDSPHARQGPFHGRAKTAGGGARYVRKAGARASQERIGLALRPPCFFPLWRDGRGVHLDAAVKPSNSNRVTRS